MNSTALCHVQLFIMAAPLLFHDESGQIFLKRNKRNRTYIAGAGQLDGNVLLDPAWAVGHHDDPLSIRESDATRNILSAKSFEDSATLSGGLYYLPDQCRMGWIMSPEVVALAILGNT